MIDLSIVVALAEDRVIGRNNQLPWHIPRDLKNFRDLTINKPVIMGRKTFESIGKPLNQRLNIVVTRDATFQRSGILVAQNVEDAIALARKSTGIRAGGEIMVIGGEQIFDMALTEVTRMYMTTVCTTVDDGDAYFPEFDEDDWIERERQVWMPAAGVTPYECHYRVLHRR